MIAVGTKLIHPIHGEGFVSSVKAANDELIDGEFVSGYQVHMQFDHMINGVKWRKKVSGQYVSLLIFHSGYLDRLEVVEG